MEQLRRVKLKWPEGYNFFYEAGSIVQETMEQILFKSDFDSTVNWVDKKYIDEYYENETPVKG